MFLKTFILATTTLSSILAAEYPIQDQTKQRPTIFGTIVPAQDKSNDLQVSAIEFLRKIDPNTGHEKAYDLLLWFQHKLKDLYFIDASKEEIFTYLKLDDKPAKDLAELFVYKFPKSYKKYHDSFDEVKERVFEFLKHRENLGFLTHYVDELFQKGGTITKEGDRSVYLSVYKSPSLLKATISWGEYVEQQTFYKSGEEFDYTAIISYIENILENKPKTKGDNLLVGKIKTRLQERQENIKRVIFSQNGVSPQQLIQVVAQKNRSNTSAAETESLFGVDALLEQLHQSGWDYNSIDGYQEVENIYLDPSPKTGSLVIIQSKINQLFDDFVAQNQGTTILDLGGGVGAKVLKFVPTHKVILNDLNISQLKTAAKFALRHYQEYPENLKLNALSAHQVKLPPNSVTATFMGYLVKYLKGHELDQLFRNIYDFTAPGGRVFLIELTRKEWYDSFLTTLDKLDEKDFDPNWPNQWGYSHPVNENKRSIPFFIHKVSLSDLIKGLERANFKIIKTIDSESVDNLNPYSIVAEKPIN